ncbi:unnamed protein product [Mytilus edulis]|uniref:Uncharacterized protein n=1 Tax=Mytilus edulis TaxID=6550 RepID=A0A8S3VNV9_MYTED|nr:unnamed protein product [Mytilus edulis]
MLLPAISEYNFAAADSCSIPNFIAAVWMFFLLSKRSANFSKSAFLPQMSLKKEELKRCCRTLCHSLAQYQIESDEDLEAQSQIELDEDLEVQSQIESDVDLEAQSQIESDEDLEAQSQIESDMDLEAQSQIESDEDLEAQSQIESDEDLEAVSNGIRCGFRGSVSN